MQRGFWQRRRTPLHFPPMAPSPLSLLLRRRCSAIAGVSSNSSLPRTPRSLLLASRSGKKPYSTSQSSSLLDHDHPPPDPRTSLSARMSFVFDQIDAMDRDRTDKDEALRRIRTWHQTRNQQQQQQKQPLEKQMEEGRQGSGVKKEVELAHPWPEWIELMERLVQQNYFDHRRVDEERMVKNLPVNLSEIKDDMGFLSEINGDAGFDFTRDRTSVLAACLNFGRDRFDILKSLLRKDIQILVGYGCPSLDTKVVFSAKLLRKHVHLDEGDVCSSCSLRSSCSKGYILTKKEEEARTLDVMRVLTTYGFDSAIGSVTNKPLMKMKPVKMVVRKLLHEVVKLSAVPIDPNLPPPVIKKPPPKVKQPPPPPKKRVGRNDIEMKKGDWLCTKCDFMNFAKNLVCLQCDAKRPKRQLLPGEWECPKCNFLNYRRNMACFHCDHERPPDEFTESQRQERHNDAGTRLQRAARKPSVSNAWNFDFDDNESDGADVATFEFADHSKMREGSSFDSPPLGGINKGHEDRHNEKRMMSRTPERGRYFSEHNEGMRTSHASRTGFDDFDEDDDVDSYELDMHNSSPTREVSSKNFSELDNATESEDFDTLEPYSKLNKGVNVSLSDSDDDMRGFDSEGDLLDYHHLKSSHVADSRQWTKSQRSNGPRKEKFHSDDRNLNYDSDNDVNMGFSSQRRTGRQQGFGREGTGRGRSSGSEDELLLGSESEGDEGMQSRVKMSGNKGHPNGRSGAYRGNHRTGSLRSVQFRPDDRSSRRSFRNDDGGKPFRGSYRNGPGPSSNRRGVRGNDRGRGSQDSYGGSQRDPFQPNKWGRSSQVNGRSRDFGDERPRRRIIER